MAITGHFVADFESFYTAVTKAEVELRGFEAESNKAAQSLNRMVDSFSGRKMIAEATLMAEAVERIGGASKLTEKELQRIGVTAQEATAKMRAMGMEVPAGLQKIADATKGVSSATSALGTVVKDVAVGFAALFTARAALGFVTNIFETASALKDLSNQTHINVEDLQRLASAMSEFGVDAETLGKSLFTLSRNIAGGDDSITWALRQMGLSLKDVAGLNGKELFLKMMEGLATLQGGLRDTVAAELFGARLGMAMSGAADDIQGTTDKMNDLNNVMRTDTVDALDAAGEAVALMGRNLIAIAANAMGPIAEGFNTIVGAIDKGLPTWRAFLAMTQDFVVSGLTFSTSTKYLAAVLDEQNQKTKQATEAQDQHNASVKRGTQTKAEYLKTQKEAAEAARAEAAELKKLIDITNRLYGVDDIQKANDYLAAIDRIGGKLPNLKTGHEELLKVITAAITAYEETGKVGTAAYDKLIAKQRELLGLTKEGLLSSTHFGQQLTTGAEVMAPDTNAILGARVDIAQEEDWKRAEEEQRQFMKEQDDALFGLTEAHKAQGAAAVSAAEKTKAAYTSLGPIFTDMGNTIRGNTAATLSWSQAMDLVGKGLGTMSGQIQALSTESDFGHTGLPFADFQNITPALSLAPNPPWMTENLFRTPTVGGGVNVNMNGLLMTNDPSARESLRKLIDDALVTGLKRSRKVSF